MFAFGVSIMDIVVPYMLKDISKNTWYIHEKWKHIDMVHKWSSIIEPKTNNTTEADFAKA